MQQDRAVFVDVILEPVKDARVLRLGSGSTFRPMAMHVIQDQSIEFFDWHRGHVKTLHHFLLACNIVFMYYQPVAQQKTETKLENITFQVHPDFKAMVDMEITKRRSTLRKEGTLALAKWLRLEAPESVR